MLKNYLVVAMRNLLRHKIYSVINVIGLSLGMACCVLIVLFVQDEMGYDTFHEHGDRIYQVLRESQATNGQRQVRISVSGALAPALAQELPEVEMAVRYWPFGGLWVRHEDQVFQNRLFLIDEPFLDMLTVSLVRGDRKTIFQNPYAVIISESTARKYFGDEDPIGKVMTVESRYLGGDYHVTGIFADMPRKSSFQIDMLSTTVVNRRIVYSPWTGWFPHSNWRPVKVLALLKEGVHVNALSAKLPAFLAQHLGEEVAPTNAYYFYPFERIYLHFNADFNLPGNKRITNLYVLSSVGCFLLLIACVNFTNLATARSIRRAREVGVRKVVGADRRQLIAQFLSEAVLLTVFAQILALGLAGSFLPWFGSFVEKVLVLDGSAFVQLMPAMFGLTVVVAILAGLYPALYVSGFHPVAVLKGGVKIGFTGVWIRKGLVVFQFAISIVLIVSTLVIFEQLKFMTQKNLGFDKEQLVVLPLFAQDRAAQTSFIGPLSLKYNTVKQAFLKHSSVVRASVSHSVPPWMGGSGRVIAESEMGNEHRMDILAVDEDFLATYGIELLAGRNLSAEIRTDSLSAYLLNETAVKKLRWDDPVGRDFEWAEGARLRKGKVVGVVRDFHGRSLREEIGPVVMCMWLSKWNMLSLRIRGDDLPGTIAFLKEKWTQFLPNRPFQMWFTDEMVQNSYRVELKFQQVFGFFACMAVFVACLGLLGLAAFTAEQRTKEIGVRKVLGASVGQVIGLLSAEFLRLILVANVIALPLAYWGMGHWLSDFAFRIEQPVWVYGLGGVLTLLVALMTVGGLAFKAAQRNPVDALRYE